MSDDGELAAQHEEAIDDAMPAQPPTASQLKEKAAAAAAASIIAISNGEPPTGENGNSNKDQVNGSGTDNGSRNGGGNAVIGAAAAAEPAADLGDDDLDDDDDDEMLEEDDDEELGPDDDEDESNSIQSCSNANSPAVAGPAATAKKAADDDDIEEIKDDDSDIMEVDVPAVLNSSKASMTATTKPKSNVVTIDDPKTLQRLANSASALQKASSADKSGGSGMNLLNANSLLSGKSTSGVTITPAKPKIPSEIISQLGSGVTISQTSRSGGGNSGSGSNSGFSSGLSISSSATITPKAASSAASSSLGYDQTTGQLNDPNLKDETVVIEMPSFITPYIYENPPKETFKSFREDIKRMSDEMKKKKAEEDAKRKEAAAEAEKKRKEEKEAKRKAREEDEDFDADKAAEEDSDSDNPAAGSGKSSEDDDDDSDSSADVMEIKRPSASENYFESPLGKFIYDLGMNLVQEVVQQDLLKQQVRKSQKDKSAAVMHAIKSLKKNLSSSKDKNAAFKLGEKKCRFCSFKTESEAVLQWHLEEPHLKMSYFRCNFCPYETKVQADVLSHMWNEHGKRGQRIETPAQHQCPQCPYADNMKGKLTRHKNSCDKRFRPEKNQEPPLDWEPPAKILKPKPMPQIPFGRRGNMPMMGPANQFAPMRQQNMHLQHYQQKALYAKMPQLQLGAKGRGRPMGSYEFNNMRGNRPTPGMNQMNRGHMMRNQGSSRFQASNILSNLGSNSSVTIQSVSQRSGQHNRSNTTPSISITPLPGKQGFASGQQNRKSGPSMMHMSGMKPGAPPAGDEEAQGKFVVCEICDGYIKDLEQLRNHMQYIHKVKIHPKMIHNRPPLNCQKCQFRFFTDSGLERHLLGSHGLVTASMQDLANKGQDQGRCPVCGKVYQWKLLNHVAKDHQKVLKPAHLSYKCTVCTATFGQYKLFETHVYQAHSGAAKKGEKKGTPAPGTSGVAKNSASSNNSSIPKTVGMSSSGSKAAVSKEPAVPAKRDSGAPDVIDLDDDEEIDDVEDESGKIRQNSVKRSFPGDAENASAPKQSRPNPPEESDEEGIEEIEDEEEEPDED